VRESTNSGLESALEHLATLARGVTTLALFLGCLDLGKIVSFALRLSRVKASPEQTRPLTVWRAPDKTPGSRSRQYQKPIQMTKLVTKQEKVAKKS